MKNEIINLKDYFRKMENLYDEGLVMTSFDITTERIQLNDLCVEAQITWLNEHLEKWIFDMKVNEPNILTSNPKIVPNMHNGGNYAIMMATLSIKGGFRIKNYNSIAKDGMLNAIKKDLASRILLQYPFPSSPISIIPNYPLPIIIKVNTNLKENNLMNEENELRIQLEKSFEDRNMKLTNISKAEGKNNFSAEIITTLNDLTFSQFWGVLIHIMRFETKGNVINIL